MTRCADRKYSESADEKSRPSACFEEIKNYPWMTGSLAALSRSAQDETERTPQA